MPRFAGVPDLGGILLFIQEICGCVWMPTDGLPFGPTLLCCFRILAAVLSCFSASNGVVDTRVVPPLCEIPASPATAVGRVIRGNAVALAHFVTPTASDEQQSNCAFLPSLSTAIFAHIHRLIPGLAIACPEQVVQGKEESSGRIHRIRLESCVKLEQTIERPHTWKVSSGRHVLDVLFELQPLACILPQCMEWTAHRSDHSVSCTVRFVVI